ncbi:MAG: hypothetical protein K2X27_17940, partial [Candidatus Obscuribacterales bacterium]|nr:hypothetical protein [Candidatus Obscuribacterales bacterium]
EKAANGYLDLIKSNPEYEINQLEKPGGPIGAPIIYHLMQSCLHCFDKDSSSGSVLLERAANLCNAYTNSEWVDRFFDPLEFQAERYFYSGQTEKAKTLFALEKKFADAPTVQGLAQPYSAYASDYLQRIARRESEK